MAGVTMVGGRVTRKTKRSEIAEAGKDIWIQVLEKPGQRVQNLSQA